MRRFSSHYQQKKRFGLPWKKLGIGLLVLVLIGGGIYGFKHIKSVYAVTLDETPCVDQFQVSDWLQKQGVQFYWLNQIELDKKLKQQFSCVQSTEIDRKFPTTVTVKLTGRKAVLVMRVEQKVLPTPLPIDPVEATASTEAAKPSATPQPTIVYGSSLLVDKTGTAFSNETRDDLPQVDLVIDKFDKGDSIGEDKISKLLQILQFFKTQQIDPVSVVLEGEKLTLKPKEEILFALDDSLERQTASLQLIWKQAKINSASVELIDLRFSKPVVRYAPEKK